MKNAGTTTRIRIRKQLLVHGTKFILKTPKRCQEAVILNRIHSITAQRKRRKRQKLVEKALYRMNNINPTKNESEQFLLHQWLPSCLSFYESCGKESQSNTFAIFAAIFTSQIKRGTNIYIKANTHELHKINLLSFVDFLNISEYQSPDIRHTKSTHCIFMKHLHLIVCHAFMQDKNIFNLCIFTRCKRIQQTTVIRSSIKIWLCCYL